MRIEKIKVWKYMKLKMEIARAGTGWICLFKKKLTKKTQTKENEI